MNRCPITYETLAEGLDYSAHGLQQLDRGLRAIARLELSAQQLREEAIRRVGKMSVQGAQPKLTAILRIKEGRFEIVDCGGRYILKPPSLDYAELPANEDLSMRMAAVAGIEVPVHGLLRGGDDSLSYFVKRFDRQGHQKLLVEDFSQLTGGTRETKYDSSMEKVAAVIDRFCTFPLLDRLKLFERTLFCYLTGNEDMHLKNFSLITRGGKVELAPAYDFVNTTIALPNPQEELALPLNGKKSKLARNDILRYFAIERLELNQGTLDDVLARFQSVIPQWRDLLDRSFLSETMKMKYAAILEARLAILRR